MNRHMSCVCHFVFHTVYSILVYSNCLLKWYITVSLVLHLRQNARMSKMNKNHAMKYLMRTFYLTFSWASSVQNSRRNLKTDCMKMNQYLPRMDQWNTGILMLSLALLFLSSPQNQEFWVCGEGFQVWHSTYTDTVRLCVQNPLHKVWPLLRQVKEPLP